MDDCDTLLEKCGYIRKLLESLLILHSQYNYDTVDCKSLVSQIFDFPSLTPDLYVAMMYG